MYMYILSCTYNVCIYMYRYKKFNGAHTLASSSGEAGPPTAGWAPSCCSLAAPSPRRSWPNIPRIRRVVVSASMDFLDSWSSFLSMASLSFSRLSMSPCKISIVLLNFLQKQYRGVHVL